MDLDTTNIPTKDYRSYVRFANLAVPLGPATSIQIDTDAYGSVNAGEAGSYRNIQSGVRRLIVVYGLTADSLLKNFETERKATVFALGDSSLREYLVFNERYIYEPPGAADGALLRVVHASPNVGALQVKATLTGTTTTVTSGLAYKQASAYSKLNAVTYSFTITSGTDTLFVNVGYQFDVSKRYTLAVFDRRASIQQRRFEDD